MPTDFEVALGQVTFDSEGMEGGKYHSRHIHWPGGASGVTIGRGYDMGNRNRHQIVTDLTAVGCAPEQADALASAAGLTAADARQFVNSRRSEIGEITPRQQKLLFERIYATVELDTKRICQKDDVVERYGEVDFETLNPLIWELVIDLRYRGDYTGVTRIRVQPPVVSNDLVLFTSLIGDRDFWASVPNDRFTRRVNRLR